jgi:alpha-tubulin suppressor-like RCC1 family protein
VAVTGITGATQLTAGDFTACAIVSGGAIDCWGSNGDDGELGSGSFNEFSNVPVPVVGVTGAIQVSAGNSHACAVLGGGVTECWGDNSVGEYGMSAPASSHVPVVSTGFAGATQVAAGNDFTCAVMTAGTARCAGSDGNGQLGDGPTPAGNSAVPRVVPTVGGATAVTVGNFHACVLLIAGTVKCWGYNHDGEVGNGALSTAAAPGAVDPAIRGAVGFDAGSAHNCVVVTGGGVKCFGSDLSGQLGDGGVTNVTTAVDVLGIP